MAYKLGENGLPRGMGFYWNGNYIYSRIWRNGKLHGPFSTGTDNWKDAVKWREEKLDEILKLETGEAVKVAVGVRISELLDDYLQHLRDKEADAGVYMERKHETTSYRAESKLKLLHEAFGHMKVEDLNVEVLKAYKAKRRELGRSVVTINTEFRLLRAALRRGSKPTGKNGGRKVNPAYIAGMFDDLINERAERNAQRHGVITPEDYEKILNALAPHLKPVFACVYYTGMRAKEMKFIRRSQVDFKEGLILLNAAETKDGKDRHCPMNDHVKAIMLAWEQQTQREHKGCEWFFHFQGQQLGNWKTGWNAALKRCGLRVKEGKKWVSKVLFHDTRRTMITNADEDGMEEKDIMRAAGHSTVGMSRNYNQSKRAAQRLKDAQNKRLGVVSTPPAPSAPAASNGDLKASLQELRELRDGGLLPEDLYRAEVAEVMKRRKG